MTRKKTAWEEFSDLGKASEYYTSRLNRKMGLLDSKSRVKPDSGGGMGTVLMIFLVICFVGTNLLALHAFSMSRDVANFVMGDRARANVMDTELFPKLAEQFQVIQKDLEAFHQVRVLRLITR